MCFNFFYKFGTFLFVRRFQRHAVSVPRCLCEILVFLSDFNPLTPNDRYSGRTAPLTSKRCILYIYSTHIGTEYFNLLTPELFF